MAKPVITFEIYKAKDGVRWRARHRNGNLVAESGEAYERDIDCVRSLSGLTRAISESKYEVTDTTTRPPQQEGEIVDIANEG